MRKKLHQSLMRDFKVSPPQPPAAPALDSRVHCGELIKERLLPDTVALANAIVQGMAARAKPHASGDDGTGIIVQICDRAKLHAALALPGSPVVPSLDPGSSAKDFCEWLVRSAMETPEVDRVVEIVIPENQKKSPTTRTGEGQGRRRSVVAVGLHRVTLQDANAIVYTQWQRPEWVLAMRERGVEQFALVLCIASGDLVTMYEPVHVFD